MTDRVLNINDIDATNRPVIYTCYGLGSCIGLFISDRVRKVSGGAHIPLLTSSGSEFLDAPLMIGRLLQLLKGLGSDLNCLRAKVAGGARVYDSSHDIGRHNARIVLEHLVDERIFVAAKDVGGTEPRTARFNSLTGELHISTLERTYSI